MKILLTLRSLLAALLISLLGTGATAQQPTPLAAYGALPDVEDAAVSPTGKHIAILLTQKGQRMIVMFDPSLQVIRQLVVGDAKIRSFDWIGDDHLLLLSSQTEKLGSAGTVRFTSDIAEISSARIIPVAADKQIETVFDKARHLMGAVLGSYGVRQIDGRWTAHFGAIQLESSKGSNRTTFVFNHGRPFLYAVDIEDNKPRRVAAPGREGIDRDWLLDAQGNVAASIDVSTTTGEWKLSGPSGTVIVSGADPSGRVGLVGLGYDGTSVIYSSRDPDLHRQWFEISLTGGQPKPFLRDVDVDRLYFDEITGHLIGYLDIQNGPVFANPEHQTAVENIRKAFGDLDMRMIDWTPDFKQVLVRTSGNKDSGTWYLVDVADGKATAIAYERMPIGPEKVGQISRFAYTAADGLEMDGILTLPPGKQAQNLPVVALPHGGPSASDEERFDWWAQAFASRGYAVFQPNFRGSTNRGQAFKLAGYGQWGRAMQTDISDGLAALAAKGVIDKDRACIVGASYGGYAALAGVTIQQGLYRCAIAVAPVSDIEAMYNEDVETSGGARVTRSALVEQLGPRAGWDAVSPRRLANKADAPILLIHGRDDTVVPYSHSQKMADALKDAGKPFELVTLQGEDHWLSLSSTRLRMLEAAVEFVEKHNPAD